MKKKLLFMVFFLFASFGSASAHHIPEQRWIKRVWVDVPDPRYGKWDVLFRIPPEYAEECKKVYFTGYTPGSNNLHAVQYLCASTLRGVEFYYFNDYNGNPRLLGICKSVPIGNYRYYKFIYSRFVETDIDGLDHWICWYVRVNSDSDVRKIVKR
jgi:hypothetical protein